MYFERLEDRQLMAVTTSLAGGSLTITGDSAADDIAIVGTARAGELVVYGNNGTFVNGTQNGLVTISGVSGDVTVDLNGGNDVLSMDSTYIAGAITINTGDGDDSVTLGAHSVVSPARDLAVNTGAGNDRVSELQYAVYVGGAHAVDLGAGDDVATLVGASAVGGRHALAFQHPGIPSVSLAGGDGNDSLLAIGVTARLQLYVQGGLGANSLAVLSSAGHTISVSAPGGTLYLDTVFAETAIYVSTVGPADSSISMFRCQCTTMSVTTGGGDNSVHIYGNAVNGPPYQNIGGEPATSHPHLYVFADRSVSGTAYDNVNTVRIDYNLASAVTVWLGDGDDVLSLAGNLVAGAASLDGFMGQNRLRLSANHLGALTVQNFVS
jgi:hypothetical protein